MSGMDMEKLLEQAQAFQKRMVELQEELGRRTVMGQAGGGMVTVTINGKMEVVSVKLEPQCVDPRDIPMLQDLIAAATNQAIGEARAMVEREMGAAASLSGVLGGLGG